MNMNRFRNSCERISLPDFSSEELLKSLKELLKIDREWIPSKIGHSLYIRPTAIADNSDLGVGYPNAGKIFVVCSPVGSYYPSGFAPINLYCENKGIRCAPGGSGCYKIGSNYGPTIQMSRLAEEKGYN